MYLYVWISMPIVTHARRIRYLIGVQVSVVDVFTSVIERQRRWEDNGLCGVHSDLVADRLLAEGADMVY